MTPTFWSAPLQKADVYIYIENQIKSLPSNQLGFTVSSKELQDTIETNIERLIVYFSKGERKLTLYIPIHQWRLPQQLLTQPPFSKLTEETDFETFANLILPKNQVKEIQTYLNLTQQIVLILPIMQIVLLIVGAISIASVYALGKDTAGKIRGTFELVFVSGLFTTLGSYGVLKILEKIINGYPGMNPYLKEVFSDWISDFLSIGQLGGLTALIGGLLGILSVSYLVRTGHVHVEKESEPQTNQKGAKSKKKIIIAILVFLLLAFVISKGKFTLTMTRTGQDSQIAQDQNINEEQKENKSLQKNLILSDAPYVSQFGWSMKYPQGWSIKKHDPSQTVLIHKTSNQTERDWASLAVEPFDRVTGVKDDEFLKVLSDVISTGRLERHPNSKLVGTPMEDEWNGFKRFIAQFDYTDKESSLALRQLRWYLLPIQETRQGYLLYSTSPVTRFDSYESILKNAMSSFKIDQ